MVHPARMLDQLSLCGSTQTGYTPGHAQGLRQPPADFCQTQFRDTFRSNTSEIAAGLGTYPSALIAVQRRAY
jgi:hypothetical protein